MYLFRKYAGRKSQIEEIRDLVSKDTSFHCSLPLSVNRAAVNSANKARKNHWQNIAEPMHQQKITRILQKEVLALME